MNKTTIPATKHVAYYRVSTDQQGRSGLGLDAQRTAVATHIARTSGEVVGEFVEVESTRRKRRPQLEAALKLCRQTRARLVIAKLDRLARNVAFIANLMESRVDFIAVDNPHASRLVLHVLAAFAEHEREQIGERTRAALAAAKARGVRLGRTGVDRARENIAAADAFALAMAPVIEGLREEGITTVRAMRDELNARDVPTAKGGMWHLATVWRVVGRGAALT
ncbi:MAG: recombinase family protein [Phaeospirillum sp.]|nr:recombinase family protein [Phaeospirillum sp.]